MNRLGAEQEQNVVPRGQQTIQRAGTAEEYGEGSEKWSPVCCCEEAQVRASQGWRWGGGRQDKGGAW